MAGSVISISAELNLFSSHADSFTIIKVDLTSSLCSGLFSTFISTGGLAAVAASSSSLLVLFTSAMTVGMGAAMLDSVRSWFSEGSCPVAR